MPRIPYYEVENATGKHAELLGKLNAAIAAIRANGKYQQIQQRYFSFDIYGD